MPKKVKVNLQPKSGPKNSLGQKTARLVEVGKKKKTSKPKVSTVSNPIKLSPCALKFATAIANPWSPDARGACIPDVSSSPSQKLAVFLRGDVFVGTNGFGFVSASPCLISDGMAVYGTTAAFTGSNNSIAMSAANTITTTGVVGAYLTQNPLTFTTISTFNGGWNTGRIVAAGLTAYYTGTTLNEAGLRYAYSSPSHAACLGQTTAILGSFQETDVCNNDRSRCSVNTYPTRASEMAYYNYEDVDDVSAVIGARDISYPYSGNGISNFTNGEPVMTICFTGTPGQTIHYEYIQHIELTGPIADGKLTMNTADPAGAQMVIAAANRVPSLKQGAPRGTSFGKLMFDAMLTVSRELAPVALTVAKTALLSLA